MKDKLQKMIGLREKNIKNDEFSQIFGTDESLIDSDSTNRFYSINNSIDRDIEKDKLIN